MTSNGDSKALKKFFGVWGLWLTFIVIIGLLSFLLGLLVSVVFGIIGVDVPYVKLGIVVVFLGSILARAIYVSWSQIPQAHVWLIELFGEYITEWGPGLKFPFPFFGFITINEVYTGEQLMELHMSDNTVKGFGYGDVVFKDMSAPVDATLYFKIVDSYQAVYNVGSLFRALQDKMDSATRSFLGQYTNDEANQIKARASLFDILVDRPNEPDEFYEGESFQEKLKRKSSLYKEILEQWGIEITGLAISNIVLDEDQKRLRRRILAASKDQEAAAYEQESARIRAEGERKKLLLEGQGISKQVEQLRKQDLSAEQASAYLAERVKWQNVGEKGATVIETVGERSTVGMGARFGMGQNATDQQRTNRSGQGGDSE